MTTFVTTSFVWNLQIGEKRPRDLGKNSDIHVVFAVRSLLLSLQLTVTVCCTTLLLLAPFARSRNVSQPPVAKWTIATD